MLSDKLLEPLVYTTFGDHAQLPPCFYSILAGMIVYYNVLMSCPDILNAEASSSAG